MAKSPVEYTKLRGTTFHYNIPIPSEIRHHYPAKTPGKVKSVFDGTMKTSDPKEAERLVRAERVHMDRHVKAAKRQQEQDRIAATLDPADARLLAELGGVEGLLQAIKEQRAVAAFTLAGIGSEYPDPDQIEVEDGRTPAIKALGIDGKAGQVAVGTYTSPTRVSGGEPAHPPETPAARLGRDLDRSGDQARVDHLTARTRQLKDIAHDLGEDVGPAPICIDEGAIGIRELADAFLDAHSYTVQNRQAVQSTIKRWLELHGDMPIEKWTRAHLDKFDTVLRQMPSSGLEAVRSLPISEAVVKGRADGLPVISYKTRKKYSDHMKSLTKYAVSRAGSLQVDPFANYAPARDKVKHAIAKKKARITYTPEQVGMILDHCATKFDKQTVDYWLPLIATYTGARMEEIGQLTVDDVRTVGNFHVIDVTDLDPAQKVKNQHSDRTIPLPSAILEAGFVEFAQERKEAGAKFLFRALKQDNSTKKKALVELSQDKRGRLTSDYGRNFPRTVREPLDLTEKGMTFHSIRHSWTDAARRAKIDKETRRLIAGRLDDEDVVEAGYGSDDLLADKLAALEEIAKHVRD